MRMYLVLSVFANLLCTAVVLVALFSEQGKEFLTDRVHKSSPHFEEVTTQHLSVIDASGAVRMSAGSSPDGEFVLDIVDGNGVSRFQLVNTVEGTQHIFIFDTSQQPRSGLISHHDGSVILYSDRVEQGMPE